MTTWANPDTGSFDPDLCSTVVALELTYARWGTDEVSPSEMVAGFELASLHYRNMQRWEEGLLDVSHWSVLTSYTNAMAGVWTESKGTGWPPDPDTVEYLSEWLPDRAVSSDSSTVDPSNENEETYYGAISERGAAVAPDCATASRMIEHYVLNGGPFPFDPSGERQFDVPDDDFEEPVAAPAPGGEITGVTPCPPADGTASRITSFENPPPMCIDVNKSYVARINTTVGDITVELDVATAPATVNNFVVLSRYHFYDGVGFHRIIPGFVVQGGDAVGPIPGIGNPGYRFDDELPDSPYEVGSLAMANSGTNTNGSQFFFVTGPDGELLPPLYSKFGQVSEGLDVLKKIESKGSDTGTPTEFVAIESIEILER